MNRRSSVRRSKKLPLRPADAPLTMTDVCCCGGTGSDGYASVGIRIDLGVDIVPQPDYPYPFMKADAFDLLDPERPDHMPDLEWTDACHFSLPCQIHTTAKHLRKAQGGKSRYLDLLTPALPLIRRHWGHKLWVVENVDDSQGNVREIMAPGEGEWLTMLCGSMFGLQVQRHRLFLTNFPVRQPQCRHDTFPLDPITGKPRPWGVYHVKGDNVPSGGRTALDAEHAREVMGIRRSLPWDTIKEGFPSAYTAHVGADLLHAARLR